MALRHVSAGRVAVPRALFTENLRRIDRAEATPDMTMEPSKPASLQQTCIRQRCFDAWMPPLSPAARFAAPCVTPPGPQLG
jgi:hypothetical protein